MIGMIRRILGISGKYKGRIYGAMGFSFLKGLLMKVPIVVTYFVVTTYIDGTITKKAALYGAIALVASVVLQAIFQYVADRLQSGAGYLIFANMRMKLGEHLRRLPMGYFTEGNIGKISSVLSTDMVFIEENCMMVLADMMSYLFSQTIMIVFMFIFDWRLGVASLAVTGCMVLLGRKMMKSDLVHSDEKQQAAETQTQAVLDFTEGIGIIKTYNLLGEKSKELTDSFDTNCRVNLDFEFSHHPYKRGVFLIYGIGTVLMLALSAFLYTKGLMDMKYFFGMLLCLFDLFVPIKSFYDQEARLTVMSACMDRIEALFAEKELEDNGTQTLTNSNAPEIEYRNVTFAYDKNDILKDVSFKANKGTMTALVGPSGGGKSTIASLLTRFWDVKSGEIHGKFSYDGKRQLSKEIVEGTAKYVTLPEGGIGLDVGCGSGALTIACAKRNPQGRMVGIDRWGKEYASFSRQLCENNSDAESVQNTEFHQGDACKLDYPDEYFDAVTSNYVYHNITGVNKQELLRETLRVLKKGGTFAIHDIMSKARYGDMQKFVNELYNEGYEGVELIDTTDGMFMSKGEAHILGLRGSSLLIGKK